MLGSEIKDLVIVKLEEYTPFGPSSGKTLLAGGDSLDEVKPIYSYVETSIDEAADEILRLLPTHAISDIAISSTPTLITTDNHTGKITIPTNYLRLHTLLMTGWQRPVHLAIRPTDPLYSLQFNEWTRGTPQKPIVTDDGLYLHYYSVNNTHTIEQFLYVEHFNLNTDYPPQVAEAIALNTARKVYQIFSNNEQAAILQKEIESVVQINTL